jgi:hypothetical protein
LTRRVQSARRRTGAPAAEGGVPATLRRYCRSVVAVVAPDMSGSGTVIRSSDDAAVVVTCYHALPEQASTALGVEARDAAGVVTAASDVEVVWCDRLTDFALLIARFPEGRGLPPGLPSTKFRTPEAGEEVFVIGNPAHLRQIVSRGAVAGVHDEGEAPNVLIDAHVHPGFSGGPVLDRRGAPVGIVTATFREGFEGLNHVVPFEYLLARCAPWFAEGRALPRAYAATHHPPWWETSHAGFVDCVVDQVQTACGLDLHRGGYRLVHVRREPARRGDGELVELALERRDGADHLYVRCSQKRYECLEHRPGAWHADAAARRGSSSFGACTNGDIAR